MKPATSHNAIKSWNLFGETGDMPDLVHCETIEVRSKLHNWELAPHRHARLHQFLLVEKGGGRAILEGQSHPLTAMRLVNVPVGCVHAFVFREGTQGWVLTLAAEALDEVLREGEGLRPVLAQACVLRAARQMRSVMAAIAAEHAGLQFARAHILRGLFAQLAGLCARGMEEAGLYSGDTVETALHRRFEALLDQHYLEHWNVQDYARALAVAPGHLSRVLRLATGAPASTMIEARIVREARRLLAFTGLPVSQVGYELGFVDPAYFTRVFSRATGLSPRRFRERLDSAPRRDSEDRAVP